jgi:hypothetical protein
MKKTQRRMTLALALIVYGGVYSYQVNGGDAKRQGKDEIGARAAFLEAYKVFTHPRCINCHPAGDVPLQGDDSHPHFYRVRRGADGNGMYAARCGNCHQSQNQAGEHSPPGAPNFLEGETRSSEIQKEPRWRLPSAAAPMPFQNRTPAQLCRQLLDKKQNGGLAPEELLRHVSRDQLVLWGWNPGEGRTRPPMSHGDFVQTIRVWLEKGGACPD